MLSRSSPYRIIHWDGILILMITRHKGGGAIHLPLVQDVGLVGSGGVGGAHSTKLVVDWLVWVWFLSFR